VTPEEMRLLFDYNAWANHRSLEAASALSSEQFTKALGSSFSSVRDTLVHICGAEWVWHERFEGRSPSSIPDFSHLQSVEALRMQWSPQEEKLLAYVGRVKQADLERVMEYKTINFGMYKNPLWQSMQHLVNHGTYHRGQVTTMLRQLGAKPILTDLMHFYRERATATSA
jgi:uncharacterized damage-inducible protein DinB